MVKYNDPTPRAWSVLCLVHTVLGPYCAWSILCLVHTGGSEETNTHLATHSELCRFYCVFVLICKGFGVPHCRGMKSMTKHGATRLCATSRRMKSGCLTTPLTSSSLSLSCPRSTPRGPSPPLVTMHLSYHPTRSFAALRRPSLL